MKTAEQWQQELRGETSVESIREIQSDARKGLIEAFHQFPSFTQDGQQRACHTYTMSGAKWSHWLNNVWRKAELESKQPTAE